MISSSWSLIFSSASRFSYRGGLTTHSLLSFSAFSSSPPPLLCLRLSASTFLSSRLTGRLAASPSRGIPNFSLFRSGVHLRSRSRPPQQKPATAASFLLRCVCLSIPLSSSFSHAQRRERTQQRINSHARVSVTISVHGPLPPYLVSFLFHFLLSSLPSSFSLPSLRARFLLFFFVLVFFLGKGVVFCQPSNEPHRTSTRNLLLLFFFFCRR